MSKSGEEEFLKDFFCHAKGNRGHGKTVVIFLIAEHISGCADSCDVP